MSLNNPHRILIIGSGGREHAIAWKLARSPHCDKLFISPGNPGTGELGTNLGIPVTHFEAIGKACLANEITMVVVGPEVPLTEGIVDYFMEQPELSHILMMGPDSQGAVLESSKDFSKQFMQRWNIPTAASRTFTYEQINDALAYLDMHSLPIVLKADGLAAGKGVIITEDVIEAKLVIQDMLSGSRFGPAGRKVVVEQFLKGIEVSFFVLTDGNNYFELPNAKDYKRLKDADQGPNTGGMGAVSPVPFVDEAFRAKVITQIVEPTLLGLKEEGIKYCGFIFFGLINVGGDPFVIEYNARLGDPETEVIIPRVKNDLVELFEAAALGKLDKVTPEFSEKFCVTTMVVSGGYPEKFNKGIAIKLPAEKPYNMYFHAGTSLSGDTLVTSGGRVMAMTALAETMEEAIQMSQAAAEAITYDGKFFRKDIGKDLA